MFKLSSVEHTNTLRDKAHFLMSQPMVCVCVYIHMYTRHAVTQLDEALRYKPADRGVNYR